MLDDRDLGRGRILGGDGPALRALARVLQRLQVAGVAQRHRAHSDAEAGLVHHVEHVGQAAVRLADQVAHRAGFAAGTERAVAEAEHGVGDTPLAHLVIQPGQRHVVALADRPVGLDQVLRHDEQRDALRARGTARNLGQHQVDDVVRHLVLGARDPHLRPEQPVRAVVPRLGAGEDVGQRRARLRLRQRHRAGEPACQHRPDVRVDLLVGAELGQQVGVGDRQHQIARRADVGGGDPREPGLRHAHRQLRAADALVGAHADQIGVGERVERLLDLVDDRDAGAVEGRLVWRRSSCCAARSTGWPAARTGRARRRRSRGSARRTAAAWSGRRRAATRTAGSRDRGATAGWTSRLPSWHRHGRTVRSVCTERTVRRCSCCRKRPSSSIESDCSWRCSAPRAPWGGVYGWLLICDPPQQSLSELTKALSVSKASVSTVARQLQDSGMIERLPSPTRQHHYRVTPGGFSSVLDTQLSLMKPGIDVADFGLSVLNDGPRRAAGTARGLPRLLRSSPHRTTAKS